MGIAVYAGNKYMELFSYIFIVWVAFLLLAGL